MSKKKSSYMTFMQKISTIHGTSHFNSSKGWRLKTWILMMLGNIALTVAFVMVIKEKFNEDQIVTQINANCKVNQVPFPAVSICNFNMVSLRESSNIAQVLRGHNISEREIHSFFNALDLLKDFNKKARDVGHFAEIMKILKRHYYTMDTVMEEVHQKCSNLLLFCSFNRKEKKCDSMFSLIKTFEGYCCAFNYAALNDGSEVPFLPADGDQEYYDDQNPGGSSQSSFIISTSEFGSSSGLRVVLNVEPDDYPSWSNVPYYGAKVMITDPNDYPETSVLYRYITFGQSLDIKVEALVFQSEADLRKVDPEKRGCWFYDEVALEHTDRYSYETCNSECRMQTYLKTCGCIPYKYPREKTNEICEFQDLQCLNNVTVFKTINEMNCKSTCLQECRDKKYSITTDLVPFHGTDYSANITRSYNISELAELQVYFNKANCNCYKLTLLIDANYFIATYGGVFSLCFGASILTLFEMAYLIAALMLKTISKGIAKGFESNDNGIKT